MATQITTLPVELHEWRPDAIPGSHDAALAGCLCPEQHEHGKFTFEEDCPVHTREVRNAWRKFLTAKVNF